MSRVRCVSGYRLDFYLTLATERRTVSFNRTLIRSVARYAAREGKLNIDILTIRHCVKAAITRRHIWGHGQLTTLGQDAFTRCTALRFQTHLCVSNYRGTPNINRTDATTKMFADVHVVISRLAMRHISQRQ